MIRRIQIRTLKPCGRIPWRLSIFILLAGLASCSVNKNTSLSRNFHSLTSHYNIYFNGNEAYKNGVEKAADAVQNDYTQILPLFLYEDEEVNKSVNVDMKRAIDKATKIITFHSISAKPKVKKGDQSPKDKAFYDKNEYNRWVDDAYILMGKSYMYQGEFFLAIETFKHVLVTFPAEEIRFLGMMWLARAYTMVDEYREAERILMALSDEDEIPDEYMEVYYSTHAQLELKKEAHANSASFLEEAMMQKGLSKTEKIRYTYVLAQLYEEAGQKDLALDKYKQVTRYNPPYEMAFNAKVSMAEVFEAGSGSSEELKKLLNKMLRDSKNREYKDQIYFALGNIAMEEGDKEQAIEYYQLSVSTSKQNRHQKGLSAVTLAEIFYEEPRYMLSAAYYDSAVSFLDSEYPDYDVLRDRAGSLGELVYYTNNYELEDSVQVLAALPEDQMLAVIDGIIAEVVKAEEEARLAEQEAMQDMAFNQSMMFNNQSNTQTGQQGGKWYFYNLNAKSFGQPEFRMKWGDRKLEDNWRRSNKQSMSALEQGMLAEGDSSLQDSTPIFNNKSREFYLATIPLSDSAMEISDQKLMEALYHMGLIYKEDLLDYQEAIRAFEELARRYPDSEYLPQAYYHLYSLNTSSQNSSGADYYYRELIRRFPDSHYAKLLSDPNYLQELQEQEMKVTRVYEGVFENYKLKAYQEVITEVDSALVHYPDDELVPKFKYIKALSVGALLGKEEMKIELDSLIAHHPGTEESQEAQEIIEYMFVAFPVIRDAEEAKLAEEIYTEFDPEQEHFFLLALHESEDLNQVSFDLLNFNLDNYNEYNLEIDRGKLTDGFGLLVVKIFSNADGAERYLESVKENVDTVLAGISSGQYRLMIISTDNYTKLSGEQLHNPYYQFYLNHYLNQE